MSVFLTSLPSSERHPPGLMSGLDYSSALHLAVGRTPPLLGLACLAVPSAAQWGGGGLVRLPVFILSLLVLFRIFMSQGQFVFLLQILSCLFSHFLGAFEAAGDSSKRSPPPSPGFGRILGRQKTTTGAYLGVRLR